MKVAYQDGAFTRLRCACATGMDREAGAERAGRDRMITQKYN